MKTDEKIGLKNRKTRDSQWGSLKASRCDICGRFIAIDDFISGRATCKMISPDSDYSCEDYETLCKNHSGKDN